MAFSTSICEEKIKAILLYFHGIAVADPDFWKGGSIMEHGNCSSSLAT